MYKYAKLCIRFYFAQVTHINIKQSPYKETNFVELSQILLTLHLRDVKIK